MTRQTSLKIHEIVDSAVDQYRTVEDVKSFSLALQQLVMIGFQAWSVNNPAQTGWLGGSEEAEREVMRHYEQWCDERDEPEADFVQFLTEELLENWGGNRK